MGELARKPGAPTFADSPMELLTRPGGKGFTLVDHYLAPVVGGIVGGLAPVASNSMLKRPLYAGIHWVLISAPVGFGLGWVLKDWRLKAFAEKEEVLKHYISLHPEDFPPYERKRYKDLFLAWRPVR